MQTPDEIRRDLPDDLTHAESDELAALAMRLQALRPRPALSFRDELRHKLLGGRRSKRGGGGRTPGAVRAFAAAYALAGTLLLAIAAAGLAGAGPFAPS